MKHFNVPGFWIMPFRCQVYLALICISDNIANNSSPTDLVQATVAIRAPDIKATRSSGRNTQATGVGDPCLEMEAL